MSLKNDDTGIMCKLSFKDRERVLERDEPWIHVTVDITSIT